MPSVVGVQMGRPKRKVAKTVEYRTVGIRGTIQWCEWLDRLAEHCRTDVAKLVDSAMIDVARARGFDEPAPPRV